MALDGHDAALVGSYTGTFFYGVSCSSAVRNGSILMDFSRRIPDGCFTVQQVAVRKAQSPSRTYLFNDHAHITISFDQRSKSCSL